MAKIWSANSGTKLATINEGMSVNIALPVLFPSSVELISGSLPDGLALTESFSIAGIADEVPALTEFRFVLRAFKGQQQQDRTFSIDVVGADAPEWITPSGLLPVGTKQTLFVLDGSVVDFQLQVTDNDTRAGQTINYFIPNDGGQLPEDLQLTKDGKIVGKLNPILALEADAGRGAYDENRFDKYPFDFAIMDPDSRIPRKLNQFYRFTIAASDGDSIVERDFEIFVVGDDFFRADNTLLQVSEGIFTADNTYVRTPIWITPANLGTFRANNNVTLFLDVLDPIGDVGNIEYSLENLNPDSTVSALPPGTELDTTTGEIFGRIPYQPAVTNNYKFTITAKRTVTETTETATSTKTFFVDIIGEVDSTIQWITDSNLGIVDSNYRSLLKVEATTTVQDSFLLYTLQSGSLPPGLNLSESGEIIGEIDNAAVSEDTMYEFTISARDQFRLSEIEKTFQITVENQDDTLYSDVYYTPLLSEEKRNSYYRLVSDPSVFEPDSIYRPEDPNFGIQQALKILVYAGLEVSQAQDYVAASALHGKKKTLKVRDVQTAQAKLPGTNDVVYEVVYLDVYDPYEKNTNVKKQIKINLEDTITADSDSLLDNADLELAKNSSIAVGTRVNPASRIHFYNGLSLLGRTQLYDIANPEIVSTRSEELEVENIIGSFTNIVFDANPVNTIKADTTAVKVSDNKTVTRFISNITNLRDELREIGKTDLDYLPLWMRTAQPGSVQQLGYTLAVPLCYCKPGTSETIQRAIEFSQLDFRQFELEVDRILVEETETGRESYFVFANREYTI